MRFLKYGLVLCALVAGLAVMMPQPSEAGGFLRERHYDYRYGGSLDPYAYRYEPRGYYPYYNSGYWVPRHLVRKRRYFRRPPYYQAWGDNRRYYRHRKWRRRHHGRIRHGHW